MNFQDLKKIEEPDFYLDIAFRRSKQAVEKIRGKIKADRMTKSKRIELERISAVKNILTDSLNNIITSFPNISKLPKFYHELLRCTLDYEQLKKSLGAIKWAIDKINNFLRIYNSKIKRTGDIKRINVYRREFYGRVSSIMKQIREELSYIDESRKIMKGYPAIKTSVKTAALFGFPNVGKTTLLFKLTGSRPDIKPYAFTTKGINVSYLRAGDKKIQLLDTPGSLNRFNKMNNIERQAYLAIKHVADIIIYVFDLTEQYPLDKQVALFEMAKDFGKPILVFLSKEDLVDKDAFGKIKQRFHGLTINQLRNSLLT